MNTYNFKIVEEKTNQIYSVSMIDGVPSKVFIKRDNTLIYEPIRGIVLQGIGIYDDDNKEIFEGDIVDCTRSGDSQYVVEVVVRDIKNLPRELFGSSIKSRKITGSIYDESGKHYRDMERTSRMAQQLLENPKSCRLNDCPFVKTCTKEECILFSTYLNYNK